MKVRKIPFDRHECQFTFYLSNEDDSVLVLSGVQEPSTGQSQLSDAQEFVEQWSLQNTVFDIRVKPFKENNVYFGYSNRTHSGVKMTLELDRRYGYFLIYFFFPSLLVIFLTYAGFWLDKTAVPARVSIGITPILITLNLVSKANFNVPATSELTWMSLFFLGIFVFTSFGMLEYGILNFCNTFYVGRRKEINDNINKLRKREEK